MKRGNTVEITVRHIEPEELTSSEIERILAARRQLAKKVAEIIHDKITGKYEYACKNSVAAESEEKPV